MMYLRIHFAGTFGSILSILKKKCIEILGNFSIKIFAVENIIRNIVSQNLLKLSEQFLCVFSKNAFFHCNALINFPLFNRTLNAYGFFSVLIVAEVYTGPWKTSNM